MATHIDKLMKNLADNRNFSQLKRGNYQSVVTADELMTEAEAVGKFKYPYFAIDDDNHDAYWNIAKWVVGDNSMRCKDPKTGLVVEADLHKGIYLAGPTGTGKSVAMAIYRYLMGFYCFDYMFCGERRPFYDVVSVRAEEICNKYLRDGDFEEYVTQPLLLINDLGAEPKELLYMGNRMDVIRQIIERRADLNGKITLFTSNYPVSKLGERYSDRVASRVCEMCNYLEIRGGDRRR